MGRVKDLLMGMEEDACYLPYPEFVKRYPYGDAKTIFERVNGELEEVKEE